MVQAPKTSGKKPRKFDAAHKLIAARKNKQFGKAFRAVPFWKRVIFLPQCLRNLERCKAKEVGVEFICGKCGKCKVFFILKRADELGYLGVFVLKILKRIKPKAVVGVACYYEGRLGFEECSKAKLPAQFVPLLRDGCANTDVVLDDVFKIMESIEKRDE
jgi:hypothetical protein